jgi:hypothetical protein
MEVMMRFSNWMVLVDDYARKFYFWDNALDDMFTAYEYYAQGDSPQEYVDGLASRFDLDSYPELNWGQMPPNFNIATYQIKP